MPAVEPGDPSRWSRSKNDQRFQRFIDNGSTVRSIKPSSSRCLAPRTWRAVLFGGTIGAAEAYAEGWWSADDLTALIRLVARNERAAAGLDGWLSRAALGIHTVLHRLRTNRRRQSRRNVCAHYDLGNDVFAHFLDPSMTYSCAVFPE